MVDDQRRPYLRGTYFVSPKFSVQTLLFQTALMYKLYCSYTLMMQPGVVDDHDHGLSSDNFQWAWSSGWVAGQYC